MRSTTSGTSVSLCVCVRVSLALSAGAQVAAQTSWAVALEFRASEPTRAAPHPGEFTGASQAQVASSASPAVCSAALCAADATGASQPSCVEGSLGLIGSSCAAAALHQGEVEAGRSAVVLSSAAPAQLPSGDQDPPPP